MILVTLYVQSCSNFALKLNITISRQSRSTDTFAAHNVPLAAIGQKRMLGPISTECCHRLEMSTMLGAVHVPTLLQHMADRMNPARHSAPSSFVIGTLRDVEELLNATLATRLSFCVIGVQPGIRRTMVDQRLSDLASILIVGASAPLQATRVRFRAISYCV